MERQLVTVQKILALHSIENADKIERADVLGWHVIVKKGDFKEGDLCVLFEIDSVIPFNPWVKFLDRKETQQPIRLKIVKMKGQISQGLVLPPAQITQLENLTLSEGQDLTELLGVTKYEPPCDGGDLRARSTRPHWIPKTDEIRVQSIPWVIDYMQGKDCYITQKYDGSSCSIGKFNGYSAICSRAMSLQLNADNKFTETGRPILERLPEGYLVQGELVGPKIQANRLGLSNFAFFAFNVKNMVTGAWLGYEELVQFCTTYNINMVPTLYKGLFRWNSVDELVAYANEGKYSPSGHVQEGIVVRPCVPEEHHKLGMLSFKAISPEFLLKTGA